MRGLLLVVLVVLAAGGAYAWVTSRETVGEKLAGYIDGSGAAVSCTKAGVIAFAGGRSTVYRCSWTTRDRYAYETEHARCGVWNDGSAYDVTKQVRAVASLTGDKPLC